MDHTGGGQLRPLAFRQLGGDELEIPGMELRATGSIGAEPPSAATGSKLAARTVMIFLASDDFTVAMPLPA